MNNQIRLALIVTSIAVWGLLNRAGAQVVIPNVTLVQISGPSHAYPTEHVSFCFTKIDYAYTPENNGSGGSGAGSFSFAPKKAATVTLRIIEMTTGTVEAMNAISVTPGALPADPCVEFVVSAATTTSAAPAAISIGASVTPVYIGILSVSGQPLPPSAVTSSLQIFSLDANGLPVNPRVIPPSVTCPADAFPCSY